MTHRLDGPAAFGRRRREAVSLSSGSLVTATPLLDGPAGPIWLRPAVDGVNLLAWADSNRETIRGHLRTQGAVLFRGFAPLRDVAEFEQLISGIAGSELLSYSYASTPRTKVSGGVYTSTEYPAHQEIPLHNEMAYARQWPMKLGFYSIKAAEHGGETPLADSRRVLRAIPAEVRGRFTEHGVMYVRNYGEGVDLSWQDVFGTGDRAEVETFCRRAGIEFEWKPGDGLRTRQVCHATLKHPETGEEVWFNQAHLFHVSNLPDQVRSSLLETTAEEDLPRNAYYGDGSPIDSADLAEVRKALRREEIAFAWQDGDVTVVENMLVAHGRRPFSGARRLVVGMAESYAADAAA
ncbi:TauD/TfdA family dioxygenase [Streptomyces mirabilis]|uniref:TauD/TfdA family dioxygenase n=1 Tax=Streptomyces mirabilis TaxID=68239 RepID=UPI0036983CD3